MSVRSVVQGNTEGVETTLGPRRAVLWWGRVHPKHHRDEPFTRGKPLGVSGRVGTENRRTQTRDLKLLLPWNLSLLDSADHLTECPLPLLCAESRRLYFVE